MKDKGPFRVLSAEVKYENPWIKVTEEKVIRPGGNEGLFGLIDYGRGTSTVALDPDGNIILVKEFYYALDTYGIQLPSGDIAAEETALQGAKRELLEEAGTASERWIELGMVNPLTMILRSPAYLFLAFDSKQTQAPEPGMEKIVVPFAKAVQMVMESEITHAPSCVAILKAKGYLEAHNLLSK